MKLFVLIVVLACLVAAGCNGDLAGSFPRVGSGGGGTDRLADEDAVTLLLYIFRDPATHVQNANYYREMLIKDTGWKGLVVMHKADHSTLLWGRYASVDGAQDNLAKARAYRPPSGQMLFAQAMVVPYPCKDIGPAELNLKNVKATYSLLVAVFKNAPERKYVGRRRRAVEVCQKLREAGFEAYFHHGPAASDVTIGAFAADAVDIRHAPAGAGPDILDARVKSLQKQFPHLLLNGNTMANIARDPRTGRIISRDVKKTYLIRIPERDSGYVP